MTNQRALELRVAGWGAVTFGALIASHSVFRPVRDALVLDGNPDKIPWLFTATFLAMLVVSPLWSAMIGRVGRRTLVPIAFHAFALCAIGFAVLVAIAVEPVVVGRVFYVWAAVFNMFVVSVFWSLLADLFGPETARRLFGPIAAGGTVGALVGPLLTKALVDGIGVEGVLVISAGLLELAVIGVLQIRRAGDQLDPAAAIASSRARLGRTASLASGQSRALALDSAGRPRSPPLTRDDEGPFAGIAQVFGSRYLLALAGYVLCTATAATFLYFEQADLARAEFKTSEARAEFFAEIDLWTSIGAFVLQTFVASRLLKWFGPGVVLSALPLVQAAGITVVVLAPSLAALVFAQVGARSITHGLTRPARERLFTVVDPDAKYRAKNAIDTIGYRFGDVASAWGYSGLSAIAGGGALVVVTVPLAVTWLVLAGALGVGFTARSRAATRSVPTVA